MTLMTLLLLIILFMVFFIYFLQLNPAEMAIVLYPDHVLHASPAVVVVVCVLIGLSIGYLLHLYGAASYLLRGWRRNRSEKRDRQLNALYREGLARFRSGDKTRARRLLRKALGMDGSRVEILIALSSVQLAEGEGDDSLASLQRARKLEPKDLTVVFALAETCEELGKYQEAESCYRDLLEMDKDNYCALLGLRDLYLESQQWAEALAVQKRIVKKTTGDELHKEEQLLRGLRYQLAREMEQEERLEEALSTYQKLVREFPDFVPAQVSLGDVQNRLGQLEKAAATWQAAYRHCGHGVFLKRLEKQAMAQEDPDTLLDFYRKAVAERPDDLVLQFFHGKFCLRVEMIDEALEQFYGLEKLGVDFPRLHLLLAECHVRRQRVDEAVSEYQKALGGEDRFRFGYVCNRCGAATSSWMGRCVGCGCWGCLDLSELPAIVKPPATEARAIHHGERNEP